jgi:hypothetical protein
VNLWDIQRSDSPIPDKLRIFEDCCTVLDIAFSVLEDSQEVDWRAPEFGSLWQHFESFITRGFPGAFMGRAASFRIIIINFRFCKILLTQFRDDIIRTKVLSFQSQWDVASLAKLIYYLGLRHEDREFWKSYFNGGPIGEELTTKAHKMVNIITGDGPLSIFCRLGHLATSIIPYHHSGLGGKDIAKVLKLQDKLKVDERLPLDGASETVWEDLDRLREQVNDLCDATSGGTGGTGGTGNAGDEGNADDEGNIGDTGNAGDERESLQRLLLNINYVYNLRTTRSDASDSG